MNAQEIIKCVKSFVYGNITLKVISESNLPKYIRKPKQGEITIFVILISGQNEDMGHWILISITHTEILYFDSLDLSPIVYGSKITNFLNNLHKICENKVIKIRHRVQSINSLVCGLYCVFMIFHIQKNRNLSKALKDFMKIFTLTMRETIRS